MNIFLGYLLILVFTVLNLGESMLVKAYAKRYGSGGMLMNAVIAFFSALFILISDTVDPATRGFVVPDGMLPLALINCLLFAAGFYSAFLAFKIGPYGLTRLISSFALLFPIFYGIFFRNEETNAKTFIGIALILVAMFLLNYTGKGGKKEENGVSLKWLIYLLITVLSNGFITILMKIQQDIFQKACDNEFQVISIGGSFVLLTILGLIIDRDKLRGVAKNGLLYGLGSGLCNGGKNFVTMAILWCMQDLTVVSPVKTGIGMISAFIVAIFFYKEKYTAMQKIGVLLGTAAVILFAFK